MSTVTELLRAGLPATPELFACVYAELRDIATGHLARERAGNTLQPTALVNEAYLRLCGASADQDPDGRGWANRRHFFAAAAEAMRRILIESARRKGREKRGGEMNRLPLDPDEFAEPETASDLLALDEALTAFAAVQPKMAELVKLRFFGGLSHKDAAEALDIPLRTANSYWAYARAWLMTEMDRGNDRT